MVRPLVPFWRGTNMSGRFRVVNVERVGTLPGGVGQSHDRAIVVDITRSEPHILTGQPQPVVVFRGDLREATDFVSRQEPEVQS